MTIRLSCVPKKKKASVLLLTVFILQCSLLFFSYWQVSYRQQMSTYFSFKKAEEEQVKATLALDQYPDVTYTYEKKEVPLGKIEGKTYIAITRTLDKAKQKDGFYIRDQERNQSLYVRPWNNWRKERQVKGETSPQ